MRSSEIRDRFLRYFERQAHAVRPSSSLVPADDPTLLFTNAGMVQFKRVFLGLEDTDYGRRATTAQKCVRAGGKHNDLEQVGHTYRHHTFFEMLGNFSFGDYYKDKACPWAWDLVTNGYGLDVERLWVTVFQTDDEAEQIWIDEVGVRPERVIRRGVKDNFWYGAGPCGPCSEIFVDLGEKYGEASDQGPAGTEPNPPRRTSAAHSPPDRRQLDPQVLRLLAQQRAEVVVRPQGDNYQPGQQLHPHLLPRRGLTGRLGIRVLGVWVAS
jgi:alanyl-tRNA synthetase